MADPYYGPKPTVPSATQGLGPHHAPPVDEHAHHLPGFVPKAKPPSVTKAPASPKGFNAIAAYKKHQMETMKAHLAAQHGEAFTKLPKWAQNQTARKALKPGPTGDERAQFNSTEAATAARMKYQNEGGLPGAFLRDTATSLVPKTLVDISQGKPVHGGQIASDIGNAALNFAPAGKAAGLLGGLKGLKGITDAAEVAKAVHTTEEAGVIKGSMRGMKVARGKQEAAYSAERKARSAAIHAIYTDKSLSVAEREAKASAALRGPLPKIDFGGPKELTPQVLETLKAHVMEHPNVLPYQKKRIVSSLNNLANGTVPTKSELVLYEHVFGKATADSLRHGDKQSFLDNLLRVANVPRSLMASFDVSAPMRQGLVGLTRHPIISGKNIGPMFKSLVSEGHYQGRINAIEHRPTYPLMLDAKLAITKLGSEVGPREERFPTDLAEKIPVVGRGVRGSGRAYTEYLDNTRADIFDHLIAKAQDQGVNIHDQKFLRGLGSLVNNSTGRGDLGTGAIHEAGKFLNTFFFSPRLLASRVNIIAAPLKYAKADPFVRREALKTWLSLAGTLTTVLGALSQVPGLHVELDPRNPDWGKVRKGNTRIDLAGGFQQPLRLAAQLYTGVAISSTTGKKLNLTAGGFGQPNRLDLFLRFFEGKEAPWASLTTDWLRNSNQVGQKFSWQSELGQRVTPLLAQDALDIYRSQHGGVDGITAAFGAYALGSTGVGLQTYGPPKPKVKPSSSSGDGYYGSSSSGSDPYYGGGSSGSSDPYYGSAP